MTGTPRYWLVLQPDLKHPSGGVKQMHRLAETITSAQREAILIQDDASFHPGWFRSNVRSINFSAWQERNDLDPTRDVVILPETFIHDVFSYGPTLPKVIFNQNTAYSFGPIDDNYLERPSGIFEIYRHPSIKQVLCVSEYDHEVLTSCFGFPSEKVSIIRNAVETDLFKPIGVKKRQLCFMPRKNPRDSTLLMEILKEHDWFQGWTTIAITDLPQQKVANLMSESLLFLSFGHPEGFGLPVAEAMACGCAVVGYSGLGGRELFRIGKQFQVATEIAYGDFVQFVSSMQDLDRRIQNDIGLLQHQLQAAAAAIREHYGPAAMQRSVTAALTQIEANF